MESSVLSVDPAVFYRAAQTCFDVAKDVHREFHGSLNKLDGCNAMAGSYSTGTKWASTYDSRATELVTASNAVVAALESYGEVLIQLGHNHETSDYNANVEPGEPPALPPVPPASPATFLKSPPAAGGPGKGLIDDALGLLDHIGVPVPDGDSDKLSHAAETWRAHADAASTNAAIAKLDEISAQFVDVESPEVEYVFEDLASIRAAIADFQSGCQEIAGSCEEYASGLKELREEIKGFLTELAAELAVDAAIAIGASFVSLGVGAAAGVAKAATTVAKFGRIIHDAIVVWLNAKRFERGVKIERDLTRSLAEMRRIELLVKNPELPAAARAVNGGKWVHEWRTLRKGDQRNVRVVDTEEQLDALFDSWVEGAVRIPVKDPKISEAYQLPNGTRIQWRVDSSSGGPTVEVFVGKKHMKVHIDATS